MNLATRRRVGFIVVVLLTLLGVQLVENGAARGQATFRPACGTPSRSAMHVAACLAVVATSKTGAALARSAQAQDGLAPFEPKDLRAAYELPTTPAGKGQTVAVVDAYDDPAAAADLAAYRKSNNLGACSAAPCFRKVDQRGGRAYPSTDNGWGLEISLDLDMVSAICPACHILLVEADSADIADLGAAVDEAVTLGANAVSNSYGALEYPGESLDLHHYDHPGVAITASTGDSGFGPEVPSVAGTVTAVGGTTLYRSGSSWHEQGWAGAGSGCSAYVLKPVWQHDSLCSKRTVGDVSAVADPNTPVAVYDTFGYPGWLAVGGTSAASPIIASVYALAGSTTSNAPGFPYRHRTGVADVTSGPPTGACGGSYLCTPVRGYDSPTGLGSPRGVTAF